jgi:UDP-glucose 4-epimerase
MKKYNDIIENIRTNMNVLITGVAGLVGTNFCEYLLKNREELCIDKVFGVDDFSGGYLENIPSGNDNFVLIKGDLSNKEDQNIIEDVFVNNKIYYIFHFAAYAAEGLSPFIRQYNYMSNVISTAFLINMGIKYNIKRFIFTSSMATYGNNETPFTEDMIPKPIDPYGIAKYACEMDLKVANEQHGLEYCIILPHNIYGKYQNIWDPYRNVLGIWMYQALNNEEFTIYGDGEQTRAFSYIDDILPCVWRSAITPQANKQRINLGGKSNITLNEAVKIVSEITGKTKSVYLEQRHEVKHAWSSYEKSERILGYKENTTLEHGLKLMWEWAREQPKRERKYWKEYELEKNIYSYWKKQ